MHWLDCCIDVFIAVPPSCSPIYSVFRMLFQYFSVFSIYYNICTSLLIFSILAIIISVCSCRIQKNTGKSVYLEAMFNLLEFKLHHIFEIVYELLCSTTSRVLLHLGLCKLCWHNFEHNKQALSLFWELCWHNRWNIPALLQSSIHWSRKLPQVCGSFWMCFRKQHRQGLAGERNMRPQQKSNKIIIIQHIANAI